MYRIITTGRFNKDLKRCKKRGLDMNLLREVIRILSEKGELPQEYRPHLLSGNYNGVWECHIKPDWLLLWRQSDSELYLLMVATGTHADLFD